MCYCIYTLFAAHGTEGLGICTVIAGARNPTIRTNGGAQPTRHACYTVRAVTSVSDGESKHNNIISI